MMALNAVNTQATPHHPSSALVICRGCDELVKPVLMARTSPSARSNIPGVFGQTKQIPCCPKCSQRNP
jgi:hypothetical protein